MPKCACIDIDTNKFSWALTIQRDAAITANTYGELVPAWQPIAKSPTIWASIEQKTGREFLAAQQITPEITAVVTTRYRSDITPANRFLIKGTSRILEIVSVSDPDGSQRFLVIACKETQ